MRHYIQGLYGKAPGPMDAAIVARVLGDEKPLAADVRPGSLVTTTYAEVEKEIGDLARSEEDVLMYALFPNEAHTYLKAHREGAEEAVFLTGAGIDVAREGDQVDVRQIKELIKLLEESDVAEVVIEEGDSKVSIRKAGMAPQQIMQSAPAAVASTAPDASAATESAAEAARPATWKTVVAPMVGTFYAAPSPGAAAFVAVGDTFSEGQPLCILEAMKLMNEIVAEEGGVIREIAVANADAVEYGTVLFYYEPA
jgi:oxaloacetate decarboxylase alpha subunit